MYSLWRLSFFVGSCVLAALVRGQSTVPVLSQPIAAPALAAAGAPASFDLKTIFTLPGVTGQIAQFDTVLGKFNVELRADAAPRHVANFLNYVQNGAYTNVIFHRGARWDGAAGTADIVQGGYGRLVGTQISTVSIFAPVALEYNLPNERGTIAAARTANVNSATSQWFFNVSDNTTILGQGNGGGYSVFGRVLGTGMTVVDAFAAVPRYNVTSQLGSVFGELPLRAPALNAENLLVVPSISVVPLFPNGLISSVISFSVESSVPSVMSAAISGSALALTPRAPGTTNITVRATDTNGNVAQQILAVNVAAGPAFTVQPASQSVAVGAPVVLSAAATGASAFQWQRNGVAIAGATNSTYTIPSAQPEHAGIYVALASDGSVTTPSQPAIVALATTAKLAGTAMEFASDIPHQNKNIYDQILLTGPAATVRADADQVVRTSFVDLNDDIVQVEFGGAGSLTITLEDWSGPAAPAKYNQPNIAYVKGRASIVVTGADTSTNLLIFSVGRGTAVNQALFRDDVTYDAMADISSVAIRANGGAISTLRTANALYSNTRGHVGVYAPGVQMAQLFIGDISAADTARPIVSLAGSADARVTGGDFLQANAHAIQIDGLTRLAMTAGTNSHDIPQVAQPIRGRLERSGADVTSEVIVPAN